MTLLVNTLRHSCRRSKLFRSHVFGTVDDDDPDDATRLLSIADKQDDDIGKDWGDLIAETSTTTMTMI